MRNVIIGIVTVILGGSVASASPTPPDTKGAPDAKPGNEAKRDKPDPKPSEGPRTGESKNIDHTEHRGVDTDSKDRK